MYIFKDKIYVTKSFIPPLNEYEEIIKSIWDNNILTNNGPLHQSLETSITKFLNVPNSTLFVNGHSALDIAIKSLNLTGEIITTPFTFASTTHAIILNNLTPVFCDININDFTIDTTKIEALITEKTSAIIPVHVFGYPCDVKSIDILAKKYNLKVIYDAAHAFGVKFNDIGIGNFGDISMFSFHATKVFNSIEGGALTFNDSLLKTKFNQLQNFGITSPESVESIGINAKMNEFQAAMGIANLKYITTNISKRKIIAEIYKNNLKSLPGIYFLEDLDNVTHNYSYFPIVIDENISGITRNTLYNKLQYYNIFTRKYFYPLTNTFHCYNGLFDNNLPVANYVSDRILTLPIYPDLSSSDAYNICEILTYIIKK